MDRRMVTGSVRRAGKTTASYACIALMLAGCGSSMMTGADTGPQTDAATDNTPMPTGLPVLGAGSHSPSMVRIREIGNANDGLNVPRDLAFNPEAPDQLWVVNFGTSSMTIFRQTGTQGQTSMTRGAFGNTHFLARGSGLAFGAPGMLATAQDENEVTQPTTPPDFMGPTLWDSNLDIFDAGHASHLDMLHNSPLSTGIAWEMNNVYWLHDGAHNALARYDFGEPHEHGGEDHSDGTVRRYVAGELQYVPGVASHLEFDQTTRLVYVADTGHSRIAMLDPSSATDGRSFGPNYDGGRRITMNFATLLTFIDGAPIGMQRPSGIALVNNVFYITDNATSRVLAFDRNAAMLDYLDLSDRVPAGGLQGITLDAMGRIYLVDSVNNRVLEIAAP